jgi:hypothetical protein
MVRNGRAIALGLAALLVAAVDTGVVLTHGDGPVTSATTTLTQVHDATLVAPDGRSTRARVGERVPSGDVVRTGRAGSAELVTRGRTVYLEANAAIAVINGARQQLRTGRAVVDALHGPALRLAIATDNVEIPAGSATEAQRSVSVQIGSLAGPAQASSTTGRQLRIPNLGEATVDGDALPATTTPMHLTDAAAEAAVVPALVSDDVNLNELARGIDASGGAAAAVVETAWTGTTSAMPKSTPTSERVLPMVIADAASAAGGTREGRYDRVVSWRRAGGSWGVLAALLKTDAGAVEAAFNTLQGHQPTGRIGTVSVQSLAKPRVHAGQPGAKSSHGPAGRSGTTAPASSPPASGGGHHGGAPAPTPTPTPTPSTGPVTTVVGTVTGVVGTVVGLLPTLPPKLLPIPLPTPTGGLVGGLLGGH